MTKDLLNQLAFVRRGALYADRQGKIEHVGDGKDLRALATPGWPNRQAPFLADAKVASTKASSNFSRPRT